MAMATTPSVVLGGHAHRVHVGVVHAPLRCPGPRAEADDDKVPRIARLITPVTTSRPSTAARSCRQEEFIVTTDSRRKAAIRAFAEANGTSYTTALRQIEDRESGTMTDGHAFLSAVMDMSTGVLHQHGLYDSETKTSHGPLDHIAVSGSVLDDTYRQFLLADVSITRSDLIDVVRANPAQGVVLSVSLEAGDEDLDIFIPLTASVVEAHTVVKTALDDYVERHFGGDFG